jgi:hypothetical protein
MLRINVEVIKVPTLGAAKRTDPLAKMRQSTGNVDFGSIALGFNCDQRLDTFLFVYPAPNLALVFV